MKEKLIVGALALLLVPGCGTLDTGTGSGGDGGESRGLVNAFAPDDPRGILARAGGTDIGLTQRSTAADGTVVFHAEAPLLAEDQNVFEDIYLRTPDEELIRITRAFTGAEANNASMYPCISDDGNIVAFCSRANNLVPGDANNDWDVFVHNRTTGITSLVSVDNNGVQGTRRSLLPSLSADGTKVTFVSQAPLTPEKTSTRQDVFVRDLTAGTTTLVSHDGAGGSGNSHSYDPVFSGDGTKIAYASNSSNLVAGDTNGRQDIFLYDVVTGVTQRVTDGNSHSYWPSLSTDGSKLAFTSLASNLVAGDTNARRDVFVWDGNDFTAVTHGDGHAGRVVINGAGSKVAFSSLAENLTADGNGQNDLFRATLSDVPETLQRLTDGIGQNDQASMNWGGDYLSFIAPGGEVTSTFTSSVWLSMAIGTAVSTGEQGRIPILGDFDGDGISEGVTVQVFNGNIKIFHNDGAGNLSLGRTIDITGPELGFAEDVNGDSFVDLVIVASSGTHVLLNNGLGELAFHEDSPFAGPGPGGGDLTVGDFDGDGDLDFAVARLGLNTTVMLNDGTGAFAPSPDSPFFTGYDTQSVASGDVDGDGDIDLVVSRRNSLQLAFYLNNGDASFTEGQVITLSGGHLNSAALYDLDGDGDLDLAGFTSSGLHVLLNDGSGQFVPHGQSPFLGTPANGGSKNKVFGDFDSDGNLDILVADYDANSCKILLNDGSGAFSLFETFSNAVLGGSPTSLDIGDLNGDGEPDVFVTLDSPNTALSVLNNGH